MTKKYQASFHVEKNIIIAFLFINCDNYSHNIIIKKIDFIDVHCPILVGSIHNIEF